MLKCVNLGCNATNYCIQNFDYFAFFATIIHIKIYDLITR